MSDVFSFIHNKQLFWRLLNAEEQAIYLEALPDIHTWVLSRYSLTYP